MALSGCLSSHRTPTFMKSSTSFGVRSGYRTDIFSGGNWSCFPRPTIPSSRDDRHARERRGFGHLLENLSRCPRSVSGTVGCRRHSSNRH